MKSYEVDLVQVEMAKHEDGRWHLQVTYYDRKGNDQRLDGWYTLYEELAEGWETNPKVLSLAGITIVLLGGARFAQPRLQRPGA